MFLIIAKVALHEVTDWPFWVWLVICAAANFAVKHAQARSTGSFLTFATIRAFCVTVGACFYIARSTQPAVQFGATQYLLLGVGIIAAVVSLLVLNLIPGIQRLFVSESVQMFWEGAVPSLLLLGFARFIWSAVACLGFAVLALILGYVLVAIPIVYFVLTKQIGTQKEKRLSARVLPVLNAIGGLLALQMYLAFLVSNRV